MKSLIVEDDFVSRILIQKILSPFGESHVAVNGLEAITAFANVIHSNEPYDLICLDILMPEMDGQESLKRIRSLEQAKGIDVGDGVKVIMTTSLDDMSNKLTAVRESCDAYLVKPIDRGKLLQLLRSFGLIELPV
jgi:two-component system, chemotaxis family, chemotaxis protein CheY